MKKMLFVFNPRSGKGQIKSHLLNIVDIFVKAGYQVDIYPTQKQLDAKEQVISKAGDYDIVACSGGDGTLNEVICGVMEANAEIPIGYIPSGSTNDYAASIKLPKQMEKAASIIVHGRPFSTDIGRFNGRTFVYIAAFGAFTDVSYGTPQNMKNLLGHQAYLIEGLKKLSSIRPYELKVEYDSNVINDKFIYGMVSNAKSVGGFKGITGSNVILDDGFFEVTLIKILRNPIDFQSALSYLLGLSKKSERVITFKASYINFESVEEIPWVLDGEFGGDHHKVEIQNCTKAVNIMVAKSEK